MDPNLYRETALWAQCRHIDRVFPGQIEHFRITIGFSCADSDGFGHSETSGEFSPKKAIACLNTVVNHMRPQCDCIISAPMNPSFDAKVAETIHLKHLAHASSPPPDPLLDSIVPPNKYWSSVEKAKFFVSFARYSR